MREKTGLALDFTDLMVFGADSVQTTMIFYYVGSESITLIMNLTVVRYYMMLGYI